MAKEKDIKTNAMRILEGLGIHFTHQAYECEEFIDGASTADKLGLPHEKVYKTLVTTGSSGNHFVFVIPIDEELDLKKAARAVGEKNVEMLPLKELTPLTGYIRGGCTSIGMKKQFPTRVEESAMLLDEMYISAGKVGAQICLAPDDLLKANGGEYTDLIK